MSKLLMPSAVNQEYAKLCQQYGHIAVQIAHLDKQLKAIESQMAALNTLQPVLVDLEKDLRVALPVLHDKSPSPVSEQE